jgi:hypothetical protein
MYMQFRKCGANWSAYCHHNRGRIDEFVLYVFERDAGTVFGMQHPSHAPAEVEQVHIAWRVAYGVGTYSSRDELNATWRLRRITSTICRLI